VAVWPEKKDIPADLRGTVNAAGLHKLCCNRVVVMRGKGASELDRFQRLAAHFNKTRATPRAKVECAADAPNPEAYLRSLSSSKKRKP
jgi:hypothetical protein